MVIPSMIMHPIFIKCTSVTSNCQLLYILVNLAKGGNFKYIDTVFETNDKHIRIHSQSNAVEEYMYVDKSCDKILSKIASVINLEPPVDSAIKTIRNSMICDFVVDKMNRGEITLEKARQLFNYITIAQIIKLVAKDFIIENGKIVDIKNIDMDKSEIELFTSKTEMSKTKKRERMDSHWSAYVNSI